MARSFDGSADYLENTSLALTFPLTMACWFYLPTGNNLGGLICMGGDADLNYQWMDQAAGNKLSMNTRAGGSNAGALTTATFSRDTWHHACGIVSAQNARAIYLDGANKISNTTSRSPTINQFNVGIRFYNGSYDQHNDGIIAHTAVWDVALSDAEVAMLAKGTKPWMIQKANLQGYWELIGDASPEPDWSGNDYGLTLGGAPAKATHVPLPIFPFQIWMPYVIVAAGPQTVTLDALTLASSVPSSSVVSTVTVTLDPLTLASSVPSASLTLGAITVTLDALTLASSVPSGSVVPGAVTTTLDALTLASSVPSASVTPGAVTVTLDALTLAGSVPNLAVAGDVSITLATLILASTLLDLSVTRGAKKALKGGWPFWRF